MKIENKAATLRIWLQKFVATVIFIPLVIVLSFSRFFDKSYFGMERAHYLIIVCSLYIGLLIYYYLLKPYYVFFSDFGEKIILRYYPVKALNQKKHSIEIPKDQFVKYESRTFFFKKEKIVMYQRYNNKVARFPEVSLSALKKSEIRDIKSSLDKLL